MKFWILISIVPMLVGFAMFKKQNKGKRLGGAISRPKAFWLFYCIYCWFLFLPYILYSEDIPSPFHETWLGFAIWMWIRGVVEIIMLFYTKNWTPPIGVTHDLSCLAWLVLGPFLFPFSLSSSWPFVFFHGSLIFSLVAETYYAFSFFRLVGGKTKGDAGIWYADEDDPVYKRINLLTTLGNWPLYLCLIFFIAYLALNP